MKGRLISRLTGDPSGHDSVLIFPGGGYDHVSLQKEGEAVAEALNAVGLNAFVLDYSACLHDRGEILAAAVCAAESAREQGGSGRKLALMGFSAGGHLAITEAEHHQEILKKSDRVCPASCRPDAVILCYSVVTFSEACAHTGSRQNFLGPDADDEQLRIFFSAEKQVSPDLPPVFLWHCAGDRSVPVENSILLRDALDRAGVKNRLKIYPDGAHGLGLAPDDPLISGWFAEAVAWLRELGFH